MKELTKIEVGVSYESADQPERRLDPGTRKEGPEEQKSRPRGGGLLLLAWSNPQAQAKAVEEIKKTAQQYGFTCGKWYEKTHFYFLSDGRMLFPKHEDVDRIWGQVARSIAYGPLKDAGVTTAKVAPSSGEEVC